MMFLRAAKPSMSLKRYFFHPEKHLRMYEFDFEYLNGKGEHEATLAYVVSSNETQARLELNEQIQMHHCEILEVKGYPKHIEPEDFDRYVHKRWPDHIQTLVSREMIRDHDHHVYVLPPIKLVDR